jgi:hypothetical protein
MSTFGYSCKVRRKRRRMCLGRHDLGVEVAAPSLVRGAHIGIEPGAWFGTARVLGTELTYVIVIITLLYPQLRFYREGRRAGILCCSRARRTINGNFRIVTVKVHARYCY